MNDSVWVAEVDTDKVRDVEVFKTGAGAKEWLDGYMKEYFPDKVGVEKWYEGNEAGSCEWLPNQSFTYWLSEVRP